jgi:hypothetical protein
MPIEITKGAKPDPRQMKSVLALADSVAENCLL